MTGGNTGWTGHSGLVHPSEKPSGGIALRVSRYGLAIENAVVGALLILVCSVTATQVVFRFVLKAPLAWSDELATFSFVWFALLGAALAVRENAHIGVDALVRLLPKQYRGLIAIGSLLLIQAFLGCLIKFGMDLMQRIGDQRSAGLQVKIFWVYLSLPVSAALMLLHTLPELRRLVSDLRAIPTVDPEG
jgi:TRAP-type transport system small permease protein